MGRIGPHGLLAPHTFPREGASQDREQVLSLDASRIGTSVHQRLVSLSPVICLEHAALHSKRDSVGFLSGTPVPAPDLLGSVGKSYLPSSPSLS